MFTSFGKAIKQIAVIFYGGDGNNLLNGNVLAPNADHHKGQYYNAHAPNVPLVRARLLRMH